MIKQNDFKFNINIRKNKITFILSLIGIIVSLIFQKFCASKINIFFCDNLAIIDYNNSIYFLGSFIIFSLIVYFILYEVYLSFKELVFFSYVIINYFLLRKNADEINYIINSIDLTVVVFVIILIYNFIKQAFYNKRENAKISLLSSGENKVEQSDEIDYERIYSQIVKQIININIDNAFIISLNGPYGSGKSVLLNKIKKSIENEKINEDIIINSFSPWGYTNIELQTKGFLDAINEMVSPFSLSLRYEFLNLTDKLLDVKSSLSGILFPILSVLGINSSDKDSSIDRIKRKIKKLDKKFVLLIDDLDRLEKEEILNIFKLVRSVADFNNFVFIIVYDKENVKKITGKEDDFLNKFFDLRIDLFERSVDKIDDFIFNTFSDLFNNDRFKNYINIKLIDIIKKPLVFSNYFNPYLNSAISETNETYQNIIYGEDSLKIIENKMIKLYEFFDSYREIIYFKNYLIFNLETLDSTINNNFKKLNLFNFHEYFLLQLVLFKNPELRNYIYNNLIENILNFDFKIEIELNKNEKFKANTLYKDTFNFLFNRKVLFENQIRFLSSIRKSTNLEVYFKNNIFNNSDFIKLNIALIEFNKINKYENEYKYSKINYYLKNISPIEYENFFILCLRDTKNSNNENLIYLEKISEFFNPSNNNLMKIDRNFYEKSISEFLKVFNQSEIGYYHKILLKILEIINLNFKFTPFFESEKLILYKNVYEFISFFEFEKNEFDNFYINLNNISFFDSVYKYYFTNQFLINIKKEEVNYHILQIINRFNKFEKEEDKEAIFKLFYCFSLKNMPSNSNESIQLVREINKWYRSYIEKNFIEILKSLEISIYNEEEPYNPFSISIYQYGVSNSTFLSIGLKNILVDSLLFVDLDEFSTFDLNEMHFQSNTYFIEKNYSNLIGFLNNFNLALYSEDDKNKIKYIIDMLKIKFDVEIYPEITLELINKIRVRYNLSSIKLENVLIE
jgi:hypothetical protein